MFKKLKMIIQIDPSFIDFWKGIQSLCKVPYYGHAKGCPNYGKKDGCPPGLPLINKVFDFSKNIYLIYTEFNVWDFAKRMKQLHPKWSERQVYNCRLWQPTARKEHRKEIEKLLSKNKELTVIKSPEAHGVNVTDLLGKVGVGLEWPPRKITRVVSLAGNKI